jgi:hypothetical protein
VSNSRDSGPKASGSSGAKVDTKSEATHDPIFANESEHIAVLNSRKKEYRKIKQQSLRLFEKRSTTTWVVAGETMRKLIHGVIAEWDDDGWFGSTEGRLRRTSRKVRLKCGPS